MSPAFFNMGPWEILIILVIILLLFGARKLPGLARSLGKSLSEFRRGREEGEQGLKELDASKQASEQAPAEKAAENADTEKD